MGEQQHVLGAEEGPWLLPHRFPHAVVTPDLQIMHMFFKTAQPPLRSRLVLVTSAFGLSRPHLAPVFLYCSFIALIATSAHWSCFNLFMQSCHANVCTFLANFVHTFNRCLTLYLRKENGMNWPRQAENVLKDPSLELLSCHGHPLPLS